MGDRARAEPVTGRNVGPGGLRDILFRFGSSIFIGVVAVIVAPDDRWVALWFAATAVVQAAAWAVSRPMRRHPDRPVSPRRRRVHDGILALSAIVFAAAGPMLWFLGGWGAGVFALFMLAGAAVHVIVRSADHPRQLWACSAPFLVIVLALPLIGLFHAPPDKRGILGVIVLAAALLVIRIAAAGWMSIRNAQRAREALEEARRDRLRAEAASAAKSEFLDLMGHELRTPLNGVLGMAQAMSAADLQPEQRQQLDVIRASGEILLLLVNDVLEFSRADVAEVELDCATVEPRLLAQEAEEAFSLFAKARGVSLSVVCLPSAGERRAGDPHRVLQVIRSVASVALKSAAPGDVAIVLAGDTDELRVEIIGRLRRDLTATPGGSVILGVARDLARRMGGDLEIVADADDEVRLAVRMALPFQSGALPVAGEPTALSSAFAADGRLRVLAAEDNPTNQLVLKTLLEQAGVAVHIVSDGEEAVAAWRSAPWDVVLMDIRMPRMDGVAATRAIRALEAAAGQRRTPILAVTADAMSHQSQLYAEAGMDGVVSKPIQFAELAAVVAAAAQGPAPGELLTAAPAGSA